MNTTHTSEPIEQKERQKATRLLDELDLRDYFAAKAMQSFVAAWIAKSSYPETDLVLAEHAYAMADAMLRAREEK
jgi:hypothetical protein